MTPRCPRCKITSMGWRCYPFDTRNVIRFEVHHEGQTWWAVADQSTVFVSPGLASFFAAGDTFDELKKLCIEYLDDVFFHGWSLRWPQHVIRDVAA